MKTHLLSMSAFGVIFFSATAVEALPRQDQPREQSERIFENIWKSVKSTLLRLQVPDPDRDKYRNACESLLTGISALPEEKRDLIEKSKTPLKTIFEQVGHPRDHPLLRLDGDMALDRLTTRFDRQKFTAEETRKFYKQMEGVWVCTQNSGWKRTTWKIDEKGSVTEEIEQFRTVEETLLRHASKDRFKLVPNTQSHITKWKTTGSGHSFFFTKNRFFVSSNNLYKAHYVPAWNRKSFLFPIATSIGYLIMEEGKCTIIDPFGIPSEAKTKFDFLAEGEWGGKRETFTVEWKNHNRYWRTGPHPDRLTFHVYGNYFVDERLIKQGAQFYRQRP